MEKQTGEEKQSETGAMSVSESAVQRLVHRSPQPYPCSECGKQILTDNACGCLNPPIKWPEPKYYYGNDHPAASVPLGSITYPKQFKR